MRKFLNYLITVIFSMVILPMTITLIYKEYNINNENAVQTFSQIQNSKPNYDNEIIQVYNPEVEIIEDIGIEEYIKGVVAAEMPALFEEEALKAQAVAARTYALKTVGTNVVDIVESNIGQAYLTKEELKQKWGANYIKYWEKISKIVDDTRDEVIVYNDEMIEAVFHSTSAGYTENSENMWSVALPYLRSVDSHQDENAPEFISKKTISESELINKIQSKYDDIALTEVPLLQQIQIIERSEGGYVIKIQIGNKIISGRELREILELKSSNFTIEEAGKDIIFTTRGYGHGVGMSQYGANYMAKEGKKYNEILEHYYQGTKIKKYNE